MSDVHMLDANTLTWTKLVTNGELLPPRDGHTTIALGKNLFVFVGFTDVEDLYNDLYMFDLETITWTKVMTIGEGPSVRFSMVGSTLHPQHGGVFIFIGGCNKKLKALDDMFYLFTGIVTENERDERKLEKLSLRKQLLKSQEQQVLTLTPKCDTDTPTAMPNRQNVYLNEYHNSQGKRTFQAKVTKNITNCYTIETIIDGKPLRGVLFSNNVKKNVVDDLRRKRVVVESVKKGFEHDTTKSTEPEHHTPGTTSASSDMKTPAASNASPPHEVIFVILIIISLFCFRKGIKSSLEVNKLNPSTAVEDIANSISNPNLDGESQPLTGEEHGQIH
uniref:Uncharacterized protein n=1 Tax=Lactuca sativa TaxID=4236 RepID=A0A9R1VCJ9_LACSA|nr:hypothetical protein LSAT_V11C600321620 [Lactuca sativa]